MKQYTPENITELKENEIFVFGSNMNGNHAGGAARTAVEKFGAIMWQSEGLQGQSYAIPTLDENMNKLPIDMLAHKINTFAIEARNHSDLTFYLTKIGLGIAGYTLDEMREALQGIEFPKNVIIPEEFDFKRRNLVKIDILNRWNNSVIYSYECEDNTIAITVTKAVSDGANLIDANLIGANLRGANLIDANLRGANLRGANLIDANLRGANLRGANLIDANLIGANLRDAYLIGANLRDAYLIGANLIGANLRDAYLIGANLSDANLSDAKDTPYIPISCPSDGSFIGWKKVNDCLVQLEIPEDARRCSATGRKCRCDKAKVLGIVDIKTNEALSEIVNESYTPSITYIVGEMVYPDKFDEDRWNECSNGIHFFINKQEAINY